MMPFFRFQDDAVIAACNELDKVSNSLVAKKESIGKSKAAVQALRDEFRTFFSRLAVCRRKCADLKAKSASARSKAAHALTANKNEVEHRASFDMYDSDKDGRLDRNDIVSYIKTEYQFEPSEVNVEKIFKSLASGEGVPYGQFNRLRLMVATVKSESLGLEAKEGIHQMTRESEALVCA